MKKITLIALFIYCVPVHANEPQSWWNRNVATIAGATAVAGTITTAASWFAIRSYKKQLQDAKEKHKNNTDIPIIEQRINHALALNDGLKQDHLDRNDGPSTDRSKKISELENSLKQIDEKAFHEDIHSDYGYNNFYSARTVQLLQENCPDCKPTFRIGKRDKPCSNFNLAYNGVRMALESRKAELHAPLAQAKKQFNSKIWWAKTACYTSAAATFFALGYTCGAKK